VQTLLYTELVFSHLTYLHFEPVQCISTIEKQAFVEKNWTIVWLYVIDVLDAHGRNRVETLPYTVLALSQLHWNQSNVHILKSRLMLGLKDHWAIVWLCLSLHIMGVLDANGTHDMPTLL
jgi:outer membrane protease